MTNKEYIKSVASEFHWDEEKLINKLASEPIPDFKPSDDFKNKLDSKIKDKILLTQQKVQEQAELDAVPKKLKWRFYLTWYGYAVVSFLVLFLIWFCTNIFTWTLNVPTKYTYLEQSKAFGDLNGWWELAYNYDTNTASNFWYLSSDMYDSYDIDENDEAAEESYKSVNIAAKIIENQALSSTTSTTESYMAAFDWWTNYTTRDYLLNDWFTYDQTYRFAYKDKIFPKLASEYPVLKSNWILMWSNTPNHVLKNLKIWDVSFKKLQNLEIAWLYMQQNTENWYSISFDSDSQTLSFYPNDTWQAHEFGGKLPSNKQLIKNVEKDLQQLWISTKNYWNWEFDIENYDENMWIINVFYPFKIQWKEVWDPELEERIWIQIAYDLNLQKVVSVIWIDIASYDVSNYAVLEKAYIEDEIEKWWEFFNQWALHENSIVVLFDNMQIVYIPKYEKTSTYYVPAIKWEANPSVDNYRWPKYVFQQIVQ